MTSRLRIEVLGPLSVMRGPRSIAVSRGAPAVVLSVLAAERSPVTAQRLDETLQVVGGEEPSRTTVHTAVWRLRRTLGAEVVLHRDGYLLDRARCDTDIDLFEDHVGRADAARLAGANEEACALYRQGLALWRGTALPLLTPDPAAAAVVRRLSELRAAAIEAEAACLLVTGQSRDAIHRLEELVQSQPLRERAWALLVIALTDTGRLAEAQGCVARARRLLDEHGLQPGQGLRAAMDRAGIGPDPAR